MGATNAPIDAHGARLAVDDIVVLIEGADAGSFAKICRAAPEGLTVQVYDADGQDRGLDTIPLRPGRGTSVKTRTVDLVLNAGELGELHLELQHGELSRVEVRQFPPKDSGRVRWDTLSIDVPEALRHDLTRKLRSALK